jgi:mono/diheme cytochrome c family protein
MSLKGTMRSKTKTKLIYKAAGLLIFSICGLLYYLDSSVKPISASLTLMPNDEAMVSFGKEIYVQNCASCHGIQLEGQANWRQRDLNGYLPAPPHDKTGHTWHHHDKYLFDITKYGIEKMIGKKYPNNMPAYEGQLTDEAIISVLSYIKSKWPTHIQRQHDQRNISARAYKKDN